MSVPCTTRLCISGKEEMYVIDLDRVAYIQADDHYAHVYYSQDSHFMVPYGLSRIEGLLAAIGHEASHIRRMGRKHIINYRRIFRVNTIREQLSLCDERGGIIVLHVSKILLRNLMDQMKGVTKFDV